MIQLLVKHKNIVTKILRHYLSNQKVYVFGSRAKENARNFSDLDLCLTGDALTFSQMAQIKEAFSESDLPYFVDVVQKSSLSEDFYKQVKGDFIELPFNFDENTTS